MEEKQELILVNQKNLSLNTVEAVSSLDVDYVKLKTASGDVEIYGKELHLTDLCKEKKTVTIDGEVQQIAFSAKSSKSKNFFGGKTH